VKSETTRKFRELFSRAPQPLQEKIGDAHVLWMENPGHPSLRFKKVHDHLPIYSARIDLDWRAVGLLQNDTMIWFWVGPHDEYERLLKQL
jgi:hypothetical protein